MKDIDTQSPFGGTNFVSTLHRGRERFLAHVIVQGLEIGSRTPDDFIRHFPPAAIMAGLEKRPALRAKILVETTGIRDKIALKKSADSAGDDLQIALEEKETNADTVVANFDPDDRVRYLDPVSLWVYITEPCFWEVRKEDSVEYERSKFLVAYLIDRALTDELCTHGEVVDAITVKTLAELLPRSEMELTLDAAIRLGREGKPFTDVDFFREIPSTTLVEHVPLSVIWNRVIVPLVAQTHGFIASDETDAADQTDDKGDVDAKPDSEDSVADKKESEKDDVASNEPSGESKGVPQAMRRKVRNIKSARTMNSSEAEQSGASSRDIMESEEPTSVMAIDTHGRIAPHQAALPTEPANDDVEIAVSNSSPAQAGNAQGARSSKGAPAPPPLPIKK